MKKDKILEGATLATFHNEIDRYCRRFGIDHSRTFERLLDMMIHFFEERIDLLIDDVIPKCPNNMLILAHHTEYINHIVKSLPVFCKYADTQKGRRKAAAFKN